MDGKARLVLLLTLACTTPSEPTVEPGVWSLESIRGDTVPIAESHYDVTGRIVQTTLFGAKLTITGRTGIYSDALLQWQNDVLVNRSLHFVFEVSGRDSIMLTYLDGDTLRYMAFLRLRNGTLDRADSLWTPRGEVWRRER